MSLYKYYCYNGVMYDSNFPMEWSHSHVPSRQLLSPCGPESSPPYQQLGPEYCQQCKDCFINGVFVYYCESCAPFFPERHRPIQKNQHENLSEEILWSHVPYMVGTRIQTIGINKTTNIEDEIEEDEILDNLLLKQKLLWYKNDNYKTLSKKEDIINPIYTDENECDLQEEWCQSDEHKLLEIIYTYVLQKETGTPSEINRIIGKKCDCLRDMVMFLKWKNIFDPNMTL